MAEKCLLGGFCLSLSLSLFLFLFLVLSLSLSELLLRLHLVWYSLAAIPPSILSAQETYRLRTDLVGVGFMDPSFYRAGRIAGLSVRREFGGDVDRDVFRAASARRRTESPPQTDALKESSEAP